MEESRAVQRPLEGNVLKVKKELRNDPCTKSILNPAEVKMENYTNRIYIY